jgi:hypothetical protein
MVWGGCWGVGSVGVCRRLGAPCPPPTPRHTHPLRRGEQLGERLVLRLQVVLRLAPLRHGGAVEYDNVEVGVQQQHALGGDGHDVQQRGLGGDAVGLLGAGGGGRAGEMRVGGWL